MLRPRVGSTDIEAALSGAEGEMAGFVTGAMRDTQGELKDDLRELVRDAGLGDRLARAIRGKTYPERGTSLEPAAWVYATPAPESAPTGGAAGIIDSFARGATIVPRAGKRFLAIPTDDVPRKRTGAAMTPDEVETRFGRDLQFVSPGDKGFSTPSTRRNGVAYLVMKGLVVRKATGRWRNASEKELAGKTRNPRPVQAAIMFILVPRVKMPKRIDLAGLADTAPRRFLAHLQNRWR